MKPNVPHVWRRHGARLAYRNGDFEASEGLAFDEIDAVLSAFTAPFAFPPTGANVAAERDLEIDSHRSHA